MVQGLEESAYTQYLKLHPAAVYEAEPDRDVTLRAEFKQKIRLPLRLFQDLRDEMQCDPFMKERETACPLEIKLISSLRYLPWVQVGVQSRMP